MTVWEGVGAGGAEAVRAAAERIAPYAHRTPVITCATLDGLAGRSLLFKCENLQRVGAFKFRGACNAVFALDDHDAARGVVTHSSGNHAQALALAARLRGIEAHVVMPRTALAIKRAATEGYGAKIYECAPTERARHDLAREILERSGGTLIPPFDHPQVIAGQGTAALELLEEAPQVEAIVAPVGGGGLMSGTCLAARATAPSVRLFGAEPSGADDAARSLAAGRFIAQSDPRTIADGLLTSLGEHSTWPIIRDHVERIFTVTDEEIVRAMHLVWTRMKLVIEPSAAVAVAAVLSETFRGLEGARCVGVILSGGNVEPPPRAG